MYFRFVHSIRAWLGRSLSDNGVAPLLVPLISIYANIMRCRRNPRATRVADRHIADDSEERQKIKCGSLHVRHPSPKANVCLLHLTYVPAIGLPHAHYPGSG